MSMHTTWTSCASQRRNSHQRKPHRQDHLQQEHLQSWNQQTQQRCQTYQQITRQQHKERHQTVRDRQKHRDQHQNRHRSQHPHLPYEDRPDPECSIYPTSTSRCSTTYLMFICNSSILFNALYICIFMNTHMR